MKNNDKRGQLKLFRTYLECTQVCLFLLFTFNDDICFTCSTHTTKQLNFSTAQELHFQNIIQMFENLRNALVSDTLCNRIFVLSISDRMLNYTHYWFSSICHATYLNRLMKAKTSIFSICHLTLNGRSIFEFLFPFYRLKRIKDTFEIIKLIHSP